MIMLMRCGTVSRASEGIFKYLNVLFKFNYFVCNFFESARVFKLPVLLNFFISNFKCYFMHGILQKAILFQESFFISDNLVNTEEKAPDRL